MYHLPHFLGTRQLAIVLLLSVALISTACIGDTATNGTPGCAKVNSGCYGATYWTTNNTKFEGNPNGDLTRIYMRQMTCDANCKAEHGFIEDYLLLYDAGLQTGFILGFRRDENGYYYFAQQNVDLKHVGFTNLAPVQGGDVYNYTPFEIQLDTKSYLKPTVLLYATPTVPTANVVALYEAPTFAPGAIEVAQMLHGTKGEGAEDSDFLSLRYANATNSLYPVTADYPYLLTDKGYGTLLHDNPPFPSWFGNNIDGDTFTAYCCQQ